MQNDSVSLGQTIPWSSIPDGCLFRTQFGCYEMRLGDRMFVLGYVGRVDQIERFYKGRHGHRWSPDFDEADVEVVALGLTGETSDAALLDLAVAHHQFNRAMEERLRR